MLIIQGAWFDVYLKKEAETLVFSTPKNVKIAKTNIYV